MHSNIFSIGMAALCVLGVACGDSSTGRYQVSWRLHETGSLTSTPTCSSLALGNVVVTATDVDTDETYPTTVDCESGLADTGPIPLGTHRISIEAVGVLEEYAAEDAVDGSLSESDAVVALPTIDLQVLPPVTLFEPRWQLFFDGQPSPCEYLDVDSRIQITYTLDGQGSSGFDYFPPCSESARVTVPLGTFEAFAALDFPGVPDRPSAPQTFGPARGTVQAEFRIDL